MGTDHQRRGGENAFVSNCAPAQKRCGPRQVHASITKTCPGSFNQPLLLQPASGGVGVGVGTQHSLLRELFFASDSHNRWQSLPLPGSAALSCLAGYRRPGNARLAPFTKHQRPPF